MGKTGKTATLSHGLSAFTRGLSGSFAWSVIIKKFLRSIFKDYVKLFFSHCRSAGGPLSTESDRFKAARAAEFT